MRTKYDFGKGFLLDILGVKSCLKKKKADSICSSSMFIGCSKFTCT